VDSDISTDNPIIALSLAQLTFEAGSHRGWLEWAQGAIRIGKWLKMKWDLDNCRL
jgi:hypothetical protein